MNVPILAGRTVTVRHRTGTGFDGHGSPTMIETSTVVQGHVQPVPGVVQLAEGSGTIDTRAGRLFTLPSTVIVSGDVVDDGTDEWVVTGQPRSHSRPSGAGAHHLTVDLAWSAPTPTPTDPPDDEWITHDW